MSRFVNTAVTGLVAFTTFTANAQSSVAPHQDVEPKIAAKLAKGTTHLRIRELDAVEVDEMPEMTPGKRAYVVSCERNHKGSVDGLRLYFIDNGDGILESRELVKAHMQDNDQTGFDTPHDYAVLGRDSVTHGAIRRSASYESIQDIENMTSKNAENLHERKEILRFMTFTL